MGIEEIVEKVLKEDERTNEGEMFFVLSVWRALGSKAYIPYEDMGTKLVGAEPSKLLKIREKIMKAKEKMMKGEK